MKITCKCGRKVTVIYDYRHKDHKTFPRGASITFNLAGEITGVSCQRCTEKRKVMEVRAGIRCNLESRLCEKCLKMYTPTSPAQKYCPDCKQAVYKANGARYRKMAKARRYQLDRTKVYQ